MLKINICSLFVSLALQADLTQKASEAEAYKARTHELEQIVAKKDLAMTDQKRLLKKVKVRRKHENDKYNEGSSVNSDQYQNKLLIFKINM